MVIHEYCDFIHSITFNYWAHAQIGDLLIQQLDLHIAVEQKSLK